MRRAWKLGSVTWRRDTLMDTRVVAAVIIAVGIIVAALYLW